MGFSDTDDMAPAQTLELTKEDLVAGSASVLKFVKFQRVSGLSVSFRLKGSSQVFERCPQLVKPNAPHSHQRSFMPLIQVLHDH